MSYGLKLGWGDMFGGIVRGGIVGQLLEIGPCALVSLVESFLLASMYICICLLQTFVHI